jgi:hypothetical protein
MKNLDLGDTMEMAKFAMEAASLLVPNDKHGYVNRVTELNRLLKVRDSAWLEEDLIDSTLLNQKIAYYR